MRQLAAPSGGEERHEARRGRREGGDALAVVRRQHKQRKMRGVTRALSSRTELDSAAGLVARAAGKSDGERGDTRLPLFREKSRRAPGSAVAASTRDQQCTQGEARHGQLMSSAFGEQLLTRSRIRPWPRNKPRKSSDEFRKCVFWAVQHLVSDLQDILFESTGVFGAPSGNVLFW